MGIILQNYQNQRTKSSKMLRVNTQK